MKELYVLIATAAAIGFTHTILGVDHYLPFVVMAKANNWSIRKTSVITFLCGIGHILSSVVLGLIGVFFGVALFKLESIEAFRGDLAGWLLLIFGFTYFIWGVHNAICNKPHKHLHPHSNEEHTHMHEHKHTGQHVHAHVTKEGKQLTPWILFVIFIFGPCEPLIPLLMYPAAKIGLSSVFVIAFVFGIVTILTMMTMVIALLLGAKKAAFSGLERYAHALAGFMILLCAVAILFLGL